MPDPVFILDIGPDGVVATHPGRVELPVLVAPIPEEDKAKKFNTVRPHLVPIGCLRLHKTGFEFDSSFVGRSAELRFVAFAKLMQALRKQDDQDPQRFPPCAVFGHADPTGQDAYNKTLAGRRALAVYAVLVRDGDIWNELFDPGMGGDHWGEKAIQTILSVSLKRGPDGEPVTPPEPPFYTGIIDGAKTPETLKQTRDAVHSWEAARNLPPEFPLHAKTRKQLFLEYMDVICHDSSGKRFQLNPKTDFIARRKDGKGLKGDVMGCGDFNPTFRLDKASEDLAKKDPVLAQVRNDLYVIDRRAVVYVFRHGTEIDFNKWPCPKVREGPGDCRKRFWSDGEKRRHSGPEERTFGENMTVLELDDANNVTVHPIDETGNLMACRFYHAFAVNSPCEVKVKEWVIRLKIDGFNGQQILLKNRRYVVKAGETSFAPVIRGTTNDDGEVRIPVFDEKTKMTLSVDARDLPDEKPDQKKDQKGDGSAGNNGASQPGAAAPAAAGAPDPGVDSDRFPDEDQFVSMVLDCGGLKFRDADDDLAIKQRLYNLGFGEHAPAAWSKDEFDTALRQFKKRNNLQNADDDAVRNAILEQHDLGGSPPPDDGGDDSESANS